MNCASCKKDAPANLIMFPGMAWQCSDCLMPKLTVIDELQRLYKSGFPGYYAYISEFSNNLDKVQERFVSDLELSNPFCTITLTLPSGVPLLGAMYDGIYIDKGALVADEIDTLPLHETGYVKWVDPTSQAILRNS